MKILDATCGFRGIWYQKNHPFVTFMDKRKGKEKFDNPSTLSRYREYRINPDIVSEWKDAPFLHCYLKGWWKRLKGFYPIRDLWCLMIHIQ